MNRAIPILKRKEGPAAKSGYSNPSDFFKWAGLSLRISKWRRLQSLRIKKKDYYILSCKNTASITWTQTCRLWHLWLGFLGRKKVRLACFVNFVLFLCRNKLLPLKKINPPKISILIFRLVFKLERCFKTFIYINIKVSTFENSERLEPSIRRDWSTPLNQSVS